MMKHQRRFTHIVVYEKFTIDQKFDAFDSIGHAYIINCLKHLNFGEDFIKWEKLSHKDAASCVSNNGYLSDFFPIWRGVRQGCPHSTYLFIICIKLLSYKITTTEDIKGITYSKHELINSLFADDASSILDGSLKSFEALVDVLEYLSYISGLKLNLKNAKFCEYAV